MIVAAACQVLEQLLAVVDGPVERDSLLRRLRLRPDGAPAAHKRRKSRRRTGAAGAEGRGLRCRPGRAADFAHRASGEEQQHAQRTGRDLLQRTHVETACRQRAGGAMTHVHVLMNVQPYACRSMGAAGLSPAIAISGSLNFSKLRILVPV